MTFTEALTLAQSEVKAGFLLDFYTTGTAIIGITDQGEFVFWRKS